ncbi:winged helix-turn-helix transcriptional regulator [Mycolicibacterium komossense]|uniref:Helix-turn-helix transcriptional regulator n=1 Tax=Mycolicibacterium komossense TaxID=1779 RepID=A0ABT3C9U1_9MYCO|nr:helix-turn-helix domain-containing protein [Mycolicibacterium komossense]MCV7226244.1 helix-turn-helix transcriptional regulator [Mycolicibacterium komossense]
MSTRSYGQYCGLARALDVVGNRWNLLIVRELLVGPARYGQLQAGLPGIATNLLAERLRELEDAAVIERQLDADSNGVAYALTPWGHELRGAVAALVNWSKPLMISGPQDDSFQPHWLVVALESLLQHKRSHTPSTIGIEVDAVTFAVSIDQTGPHVTRVDANGLPENMFHAEPMVVLGLAAGLLTIDQAIAAGDLRGDKHDLAAVFGPA